MAVTPTHYWPAPMTICFCLPSHRVAEGWPGMQRDGVPSLLADPEEAQCRGLIGRRAALDRYGLPRFLHDWDLAFKEASEIAVRVS
jgi:hypothetical protein